jgi:hypothetical protein
MTKSHDNLNRQNRKEQKQEERRRSKRLLKFSRSLRKKQRKDRRLQRRLQRQYRCQFCHKGQVDHVYLVDGRGYPRDFCKECCDRLRSDWASHGDEGLIAALIRELEVADADDSVRSSAVIKLERLRNPAAVDALGALLVKHPGSRALKALAVIGDIRALEYVHASLRDDDYWWTWHTSTSAYNAAELLGQKPDVTTVTTSTREWERAQRELETLGKRTGRGEKIIVQILTGLVEEPELRRCDDASSVLYQYSRERGLNRDPECRELITNAARHLQQRDQKRASQLQQLVDVRH